MTALRQLLDLEKQLRLAKRASVDVGLISDKVGGQIYGDGQTVLGVGAVHEFGSADVPQRSFIRAPFKIKAKESAAFIRGEFSKIADGKQSTAKAMGRIGANATNIVKGAFTTKGYGTWPDIEPATKRAKGSSQPLIDTGTLRNSIHWKVNDAS